MLSSLLVREVRDFYYVQNFIKGYTTGCINKIHKCYEYLKMSKNKLMNI